MTGGIDEPRKPPGETGSQEPKPLPHLRPVATPEPPEPPQPPDSMEAARIERYRVETDSVRARNQYMQTEAGKLQEETAANIEIRKSESKARFNGLETDREDRHVERYVAMAMLVVGILVALALAIVNAGEEAWQYRLSPGTGLLITAAGGLRLRALTPGKGKKSRRASKLEKEGEAD
jgi:hypothetical protein